MPRICCIMELRIEYKTGMDSFGARTWEPGYVTQFANVADARRNQFAMMTCREYCYLGLRLRMVFKPCCALVLPLLWMRQVVDPGGVVGLGCAASVRCFQQERQPKYSRTVQNAVGHIRTDPHPILVMQEPFEEKEAAGE